MRYFAKWPENCFSLNIEKLQGFLKLSGPPRQNITEI